MQLNMSEIKATVGPHGKDCMLSVDGHDLPGLTEWTISAKVSERTKVNLELLALKKFEISFDGDIVCDTKIVNREIAMQVYQSLKLIFGD